MKRFLFILISSCAVSLAYSQEEIALDSIPKIQKEPGDRPLNLEKPLFAEDLFLTDAINLFDKSMFDRPLLPDYQKNLDFKKYFGASGLTTESFSPAAIGFSPFFFSGNVFNQATYKLNDRLTFGGNSFGARSVFDQPKMNSSIRDMSTKGASMFMQYKISNGFKVETRVSIINRQSPWAP